MKKKWIALLIGVALLCLCCAAGAEIISGSTKWYYGGSENLTFTLDTSTGVITISGTGGWNDYADYMPGPPWSSDYAASMTGALGDYRSSIKTAIIEEGVTSIAGKAFSNCTNLTRVTLPSTVTSIGYEAFDGCSSLMNITLPANLNKISDCAFRDCSLLTSINIPASVASIGEKAFKGAGLRTVETYGDFEGEDTFRECPLTSVIINNCSYMGEGGAFYECERLATITLNNCTMTEIPQYAFTRSSITSISIPSTVTKIGESAFNGTQLTSITLPNGLIQIGKCAFKGSLLTSISIPDNVINMEEEAFRNCQKLTTVVLSAGAGTIPEYAFDGCSLLSNVTIPAGTMTIEANAFNSCPSLRTIALPEGLAGIRGSAFANCDSLGLINIPASMVTINAGAFKGCTKLTDVFYAGSESARTGITIEESNNANFINAIWHYNEASFGSLTPGNVWTVTYAWAEDHSTVTGTAVCAHDNNHRLTETAAATGEITTAPGCETVGEMTFTSADFASVVFTAQVTKAEIPATGHDWEEPVYDWNWDAEPVTATASRMCKNDNNHIETETVEAFYSETEPTVDSFGTWEYTAEFQNPAFETLIDRGEWWYPEFYADGIKYALKSHLDNQSYVSRRSNLQHSPRFNPSGNPVGNLSASDTDVQVIGVAKNNVNKLTIPATVKMYGIKFKVTAIADNALKGLKKLSSVSIGKNVTSIGKNAFNGCKVLKTVTDGSAVKTIGESAFTSCVKLTSVPVFAKLQTIGDNAFKGCKLLPKITLSANVKKIGKNAFYGCAKLKNIIIKTKKLTSSNVGANAFKGIYSKPTVTCPKGKAKTYKKLLLKKGMPTKAVFK